MGSFSNERIGNATVGDIERDNYCSVHKVSGHFQRPSLILFWFMPVCSEHGACVCWLYPTVVSSSEESGLTEEDSKTIRVSLFNLIKYYIFRDIKADELNQIIGFLVVVKQQELVCVCVCLCVSVCVCVHACVHACMSVRNWKVSKQLSFIVLCITHRAIVKVMKVKDSSCSSLYSQSDTAWRRVCNNDYSIKQY